MSWSNRKMVRSLLSPSPSLLLTTQSHVQSMPEKMTYLILMVGSTLKALQEGTRHFFHGQSSQAPVLLHSTMLQVWLWSPMGLQSCCQLNKHNGNTKWQDSTALEMTHLHGYQTFKDFRKGGKPSKGYRKIRVHLVFDVKQDGWHKSRLVADGHLTEVPLDSIYSGVVLLWGLHLLVFLAELNDLNVWATDIGNAYLEAETQEKVYIIAGPEFGELEGHTLIIFKALYGLKTSGLCWHECFANCLSDMGIQPCKAEPIIWM